MQGANEARGKILGALMAGCSYWFRNRVFPWSAGIHQLSLLFPLPGRILDCHQDGTH